MVRKKLEEKNLDVAHMIVEANNLNEMVYAFSEQAGNLLKALPRQKAGKDFDGILEILTKMSELQTATVTQFEVIVKAIKEKKLEPHPLQQETPSAKH